MIRFIRDLRLLPIALIASACLPALKTADLVLDGGGYLMMSGAAPPEDGDAALVRAMSDGPQGGGQRRTRRPAQDRGTGYQRPRIGPEGADPLPDRRLAGAVSE
jgi:hypothetical protein